MVRGTSQRVRGVKRVSIHFSILQEPLEPPHLLFDPQSKQAVLCLTLQSPSAGGAVLRAETSDVCPDLCSLAPEHPCTTSQTLSQHFCWINNGF